MLSGQTGDRKVPGSTWARTLSGNNLGWVVHTHAHQAV